MTVAPQELVISLVCFPPCPRQACMPAQRPRAHIAATACFLITKRIGSRGLTMAAPSLTRQRTRTSHRFSTSHSAAILHRFIGIDSMSTISMPLGTSCIDRMASPCVPSCEASGSCTMSRQMTCCGSCSEMPASCSSGQRRASSLPSLGGCGLTRCRHLFHQWRHHACSSRSHPSARPACDASAESATLLSLTWVLGSFRRLPPASRRHRLRLAAWTSAPTPNAS